VLTVISLDPFHPQTAHVDAPFWLFGEGPGAAFDETHETHQTREPRPDHLEAEDLLTDTRDTWRDATRAVALSPDQPYRIWRLSLHG
jgi:starch synthase (maltosyl-transferring)